MKLALGLVVLTLAFGHPALADDICNCKGYAGPGGPCYAGLGGPAYAGLGGPAYAGPGGPCAAGAVRKQDLTRPVDSGPGGRDRITRDIRESGSGGNAYSGQGAPYGGPGGAASNRPGGSCYAGIGGPCFYNGPRNFVNCPSSCR